MASWVLPVFIVAFAFQYAVETGLLLLNLRHVARARGVPPPLAGRVDDATAERSRAYTLANGRFSLAHGAFFTALTLAALLSGIMPALDAALAARGLDGAHRFVVFLVALSLGFSAAGLPFAIFHTFVLEERFGFNHTTPRLWITDLLKGLLLQAAIGIPLLYATYGFMRFTGGLWWVWLFVFYTAVQLVLLWLYPTFIAPLFNRFQPLPEGTLRERLEALARAAGFAHRGLFVMDASRRSGHSNAYFTGIFRPRIVLFDTLVERMSVDEAASVLAHEIGHYTARHVHRRLALSARRDVRPPVRALPPRALAAALRRVRLRRPDACTPPLALVSLGGGAFVFWLAPFAAGLSRRHEYEADRYAVRLARAPEALETALVRLNGENLSNLHPHPWYSAWHYSHPVLVERIAAIQRAAAEERPAASG